VTFLGFLFLAPESAPLTSARCRDSVLAQEKKSDATLKVGQLSEIPRPGGLPVAWSEHTTVNRDGSTMHRARAFVASGDICGDLEFYSQKAISVEDASLKNVFLSFQLDAGYIPRFSDVVLYAQVL